MKRHNPKLCANELHDITQPGALLSSGYCAKCNQASQARFKRGETTPYGLDHCRKGHPYDEENTYINPASDKRTCRTCQRDANRLSRERTARAN